MSLFAFLKKYKACRLLADPDDNAARKYRHFRDMLSQNDSVLDGLAALEQTYFGGEPFTTDAARRTCLTIVESAHLMVKSLNELSRQRHQGLYPALDRVLKLTLGALEPRPLALEGPLALSLADIGSQEETLAKAAPIPVGKAAGMGSLLGGKAANLARVRNAAARPTPDGFVLTTAAFQAFVRGAGLEKRIEDELAPISPLDLPDLEARSQRIRESVLSAPFPPEVSGALADALRQLSAGYGHGLSLAVRSSAVGEDGPASFAGQYESVLNVAPGDLEAACRRVIASKYSPRAILYRLRHGLDDADVPMAVLVLTMIQSAASGVLYTRDPSRQDAVMRLDAVTGLGEKLVSGEALPSVFTLARDPLGVTSRPDTPLLSDAQALELGRMGLALEEHFGAPQDVEWCLDGEGRLFVVQSRPLGPDDAAPAPVPSEADMPGLRVLLSGGVAASPGAASGEVLRVEGTIPAAIPDGAILAARNAAPELAALLDRAGGVVTAMGGAASHLASVAREMGIPALFGVPGCPDALANGQLVTLDAVGARVLEGRVEPLLTAGRTNSRMVDSPMHQRLRAALDHISPLTLTDPQAANFVPEGCETLHDVVRFTHETGMREMFGLCGSAEEGDVLVARLKARIPLILYCVDLGGGLRENLTTCDDITPEDLRSVPMLAVWRGFTHPGITWSGTVAFDAKSFMTLMASSATAEVGGGTPGGDSYALLGADYMNLSARFGYHFANVDAFCGDQATQNHVNLRFAGGAGGFSGKCLRVAFLSKVLARLGFTVEANGDVLDASFKGAPRPETEIALDQLGRLLASSRLLDMAITNQAGIDAMAEAFLRGDYDLLSRRAESPLPGFHLTLGDWERLEPSDEQSGAVARQDGSKWATGLSRSFAGLMGKMAGQRYQRFLDSIEAYFHFPLAVAKDSEMGEGRAVLRVRPVAGTIDQAAGLAFAVRTAGTYLVLRVNALEDNVMLFEFVDGKRRELASAHLPVRSGEWSELAVEVRGNTATGFVDGKPYLAHHFSVMPSGLLGLWSKADSVTEFAGLVATGADGVARRFPV